MAGNKTTESDKDSEWLLAMSKSCLAQENITGAKVWILQDIYGQGFVP